MENLNIEIDDDLDDASAADHASERVGPLKAIRRHCLDCAGTSTEVALCVSKACPLLTLRFGHRPDPDLIADVGATPAHPVELGKAQAEIATGSRLKAIRTKCLDCSGNNIAEVRGCRHATCDLHPFRMGKGNRAGRTLTEEERTSAVAHLQAAREKRQTGLVHQ
jgi:hypothetical protein